jgi:hypothetical protein
MYNVEIYKRAKFQLKIRYNVGCAKIYQILSILWSLEYKYLELKLCPLSELNMSYIQNFSIFFLKL